MFTLRLCAGIFLYCCAFGSSLICGIIYLQNKYSHKIKTLENAIVVSTDVYLSSCVDTCRYSDSIHHSDPYICYKPHILFQIENSSEMCSYVNPVSSTNQSVALLYGQHYFPLQSKHVIYKTGTDQNGIPNCNDASPSYQHKQNELRKTTIICRQMSIVGWIVTVIITIMFYLFEIRDCHKHNCLLQRFNIHHENFV